MATSSARGPYHDGERAVQRRAGVEESAARIGRAIHDAIAPAAADFLTERTFVVVASRAADGHVWASLLTGPPGFLDASELRTLTLHAVPWPGDPLHATLAPGAALGLLAIDFATRRRYRVNGTVAAVASGSFVVEVVQAFGNCPKYIQQRELDDPGRSVAAPREVARAAELSDAQRRWIAGADTFFVASAHPPYGADASHRGGMPGFVHASSARRLVWPDYAGNTMFQTLGNITADPAAGVLLPDFARGALLQITGAARIDWDEEASRALPGAERLVELAVEQVIETEGVLPVGWRGHEASPYNPR